MDLHVDQLKYLIAVSKHDTLLSASRQLHITPQALNISVKNLEKELDMTLLVRSHNGSHLTEAGEEVVKTAQTFLQQMYSIQQKYVTLINTSLSGKINLWTTYGGMELFLPQLICRAYHQFPQLEIEVHQSTTQDLIKQVQDGQLEFALIYQSMIKNEPAMQIDESMLTFHHLFACQLYLLVPQSYDIAQHKSLHIADTLDYPWIILENEHTSLGKEPMMDLLRNFGEMKHAIKAGNSYNMYLQMISSGLGIGLLQTDLLNMQFSMPLEGVKMIAVKDDIYNSFGYVTNNDHPCSSHNEAFLKFLDMYVHFCSLI